MKLLVSVRTLDEALIAAEQGADLVDLKEPREGALGALPLAEIAAIVPVLHTRHPRLRLSATVGDVHADSGALLRAVLATAGSGIDDVKVGIAPDDAALLSKLGALGAAGLPCRAQIVPVLLADDGVPMALVEHCRNLPFAALMLDTQHKPRGSLLAQRDVRALQAFVDTVQAQGKAAGLAGSLRLSDIGPLLATGCDFAGFRGAVCAHDRRGALEAARVAALRRARDREAALVAAG